MFSKFAALESETRARACMSPLMLRVHCNGAAASEQEDASCLCQSAATSACWSRRSDRCTQLLGALERLTSAAACALHWIGTDAWQAACECRKQVWHQYTDADLLSCRLLT